MACGDDDDLMDTWHLVMRRIPCTMEKTLVHEGKALRGPMTSSLCSMTCQLCQDVTLEGLDVTFRVFFLCKFQVKIVKGQN
jgi:hypothetical protein